jgi:hypothetical protein
VLPKGPALLRVLRVVVQTPLLPAQVVVEQV